MKIIVHVPLSCDREYIGNFDRNTIPNVGDNFDEVYVIKNKQIKDNLCELTLRKKTRIDKDKNNSM